jgi:hypothetical protein
MSFVYGEPRVEDRKHMWELLQRIKLKVSDPWVVLGDFNEAMWQFEHFSNTRRGERQMQSFRDALDYCDLHDIGFSGLPWTFDNRRRGSRNVKVRLDRVVASTSWMARFGDATVKHLVSPCSDHCLVLLQEYNEDPAVANGGIRRYEIMWECEDSLVPEIVAAWDAAGVKHDLGDISQGLQVVMNTLHKWSRVKFGSVIKELETLRSKLEELQLRDDAADAEESTRIKERMNEILYREEMMWLQRSRISWLKEGDCNTRYFHIKAQWRAKKNKIKKLRNGEGQWCETWKDMCDLTSRFFQDLYSKDELVDPDPIMPIFERRATQEMNEMLCREFTVEEIGNACSTSAL